MYSLYICFRSSLWLNMQMVNKILCKVCWGRAQRSPAWRPPWARRSPARTRAPRGAGASGRGSPRATPGTGSGAAAAQLSWTRRPGCGARQIHLSILIEQPKFRFLVTLFRLIWDQIEIGLLRNIPEILNFRVRFSCQCPQPSEVTHLMWHLFTSMVTHTCMVSMDLSWIGEFNSMNCLVSPKLWDGTHLVSNILNIPNFSNFSS